jgi:hypothetical protein
LPVTVRNAQVMKGTDTLSTVQFVVAHPLSDNDKIFALSQIVVQASMALELPTEGAKASEILYRLADERAGATTLAADPSPPAGATQGRAERIRAWAGGIRGRRAMLIVGGLALGAGLSLGVNALLRLAGL